MKQGKVGGQFWSVFVEVRSLTIEHAALHVTDIEPSVPEYFILTIQM